MGGYLKSHADVLAERIDARYSNLVMTAGGDLHLVIEAMAEHLEDIRKIMSSSTDEEIGALFEQFPHFMSYCLVVDLLS